MPSLVDYDIPQLETHFGQLAHKPVHASRVLRHFYERHGRLDVAAMNVSRAVREHVAATLGERRSAIKHRTSAADGTTKFLIGFEAGGAAEAVFMPGYRDGVSAGCVSSQIGCAMGCDFCASTRGGLERDLDAGEIVEQFLHLKEQSANAGRRLRTLVFMGMGEPLLNFENVVAAIRRIADPNLGGLGWRQITVSTVGIVPSIDRLADLDLNVHLAVSLHAPDDATRSRLVPMNRRHTVAEVMHAARRFETRTGRTPTIEYCMLAGVNDSDEQAALLADLMAGFRAHVNLIPYNSIGVGVRGVAYSRPSQQRMAAVIDLLRSRGVVAHFRDTRGDDVNAACGQLRAGSI
jgi:23S rRNA (adenine2503-C2)-methyltransferase